MTINLLTKLVEVHRGWCNYCAGNVKVCDNCPKGGCTLRDYLQSLSQEAVRDEALREAVKRYLKEQGDESWWTASERRLAIALKREPHCSKHAVFEPDCLDCSDALVGREPNAAAPGSCCAQPLPCGAENCTHPKLTPAPAAPDAPITVSFGVTIRSDGELGRLVIEQFGSRIVLTTEQAVALAAQIQEKVKP